MTYIAATRAALAARIPDLDPPLLDLYLLLALVKGPAVTSADVHDAWAIWCSRSRPDHRDLIPYPQLSTAVQALDQPFADAIAAAALAQTQETAA
ncbi:hypothetical protein ABZZ74_23500 [Streptomyces sp. NPDC006476]|uniref:DUF7701 domain-containing protein n=1 Tax=Streptomyces sp. NPDC006476 TaxID=3157175 RepID=UPI0033BE5172